MKNLRIFLQAYKKNIQRMFKSKAMLLSIFIGPFIILLLIQSAYQQNDIDLKIGIVSANSQNTLVSTFQQQNFKVWVFQNIESCTGDIKKGYLDFCIDLTSQDVTKFYVDESKISLVEILQRVISNTIADQSANIRRKIADELESGIESSTSSVSSLQAGMNSIQSRNPVDMLRDLSSQLKSGSKDIDTAILDLESVRSQVTDTYTDTSSDLDEFSQWLNEIEYAASQQRTTISNIEQYNRNCESMINIDEDYLRSSATYEEIKSQFTAFGQCKCVDYYRPNIISIENDLTNALSKINSARISVSDARTRNIQFYNSVITMINGQESELRGKKTDAQTGAASMDREIASLQEQMNSLTASLNDLASNSGKIREMTGGLETKLVNPLNIEINTVSKKYDMIVYLFPMMYFFILVFVSMLFSGIFTFSEIHSNAKSRNILSPANHFVLITALFASILTLVLVQGTLLVILGKIAFSFPLSIAIFAKIFMITLIIISFYVISGILIGTVMNSQLMVTFIIIGISILSLLYSELLIPSNIMTPVAQYIVSLNPLSVGVESTSKIILYDVEFSVFAEALIIICALFILLFIFSYMLYIRRIAEE